MQSDMYSTLPHVRNIEAKSLDLHFGNKIYDPLPLDLIESEKYEKDSQKFMQTEFTTFGHKRSLSGESIGRNLHLAGAKLVLPSGEIPVLKPVDKNVIRPKLPPPGPPPLSSGEWAQCTYYYIINIHMTHLGFVCLIKWFSVEFAGGDMGHKSLDDYHVS